MKNTLKVLALGAAFAASVTMAKADTITTGSQISVTGDNFHFDPSAATVTFAPNGTTQGNYQVGGTNGTFSTYFTTGNPVTWLATGTLPRYSVEVAPCQGAAR